MTLPDLTGKATLDTADFRQGIARIKTDLTQLAALASKANTVKITASLSGQSAISADLGKLRATTAKPLVVPVSVQSGGFKNVTSEASALNAAIRELGGQVRATRNIWQAQIITDDQAAASSRRLRNELLALATAEGASADAVTKATTAAAQAQRTLDQASGRVSKGGFAFNASLGIIDALSSLGGPAGLAASQVGRFIVDGLKQAMDKGKPEVRAEGDEVAQEVVDALKERLKIQSPSLVTQEVGAFIMSGLIVGIKANTKEVLDAVGGVASQIPETFKEASLGGDTGSLGESLGEDVVTGLGGVLSEIPTLFQKVFGDAAPIAAQAAGDVADEVEINVAPALEALGSGFEKASEKLLAFPAAASGSAEASRALGDEADASSKKIAGQGVALGDVAGQADASSKSLGETSAATEEAGNGFEQLAGYLALAAVGVGVFVSAIAIVVPKAAEFQSALANIGTESDLTEQQLTELGTGLLKTSARVGQSAQDLAKAAYDVVGAGVKGADTVAKLNGLTELSAKAASAGLTEVGTSADVITSALNAYGLSVDNAQHVSDVFFKTTATGKISFDQIASSMGAVFPIAATLGVSLEELTASVASLTSSGVPASQAVTGIQAALSNVLKPSSEASLLAGQLGIKFNAQALQAKGLAGFLADVTKATGGNVEQMGQLFGSVEAVNAVFALTNSQGAPRFKSALEDIRNAAGATDEAFAKQALTFQFAQKQYTAAGEALQIEFGLRVLPTLTKLTKVAADVLTNLDKIGQNGLVQFVAITGGATLAVGAVLKLGSAIKSAATATAIFQGITAAGGWNH